MSKLIVPAPAAVALIILSAFVLMIEVSFRDTVSSSSPVWRGACVGLGIVPEDEHVHLRLKCAGAPGDLSIPFTKQPKAIADWVKTPDAPLYCEVAKSGKAVCVPNGGR